MRLQDRSTAERGQARMILLLAAAGIFTGLAFYTFLYARGLSYFNNDPETCMNCHVMRHHFDAWNRSSHKAAAACNSCHTPKNLIGKYAVKGLNGWNHGSAFTTGRFPEPFRIKPLNKKVVLDNCIRCHETMVHEMRARSGDERPDCTTCHRDVGHDD